jgi:hypothetical protein
MAEVIVFAKLQVIGMKYKAAFTFRLQHLDVMPLYPGTGKLMLIPVFLQ